MALDRPIRPIRKPRNAILGSERFTDALSFLMALINSPDVAVELKLKAAIACLPYQEVPAAEVGKKQLAQEQAEEAAQGIYAPPPEPKRPN